MLLHRHRVSTLFNRDKPSDWSLWYSKQPKISGPHMEVESKEFTEDQLNRVCSAKQYGTLYREKVSREHIRY